MDSYVSEELIDKRFEKLALLGTGFLGAVYRAYDRVTKKEVALKVLRPDRDLSGIGQEAKILSDLADKEQRLGDGICTVPEFITAKTTPSQEDLADPDEQFVPYLAMELMRGQKVIDLLSQRASGGLDEPTALNIAFQLFRLLDILHEKLRKTYIDLKMENLWWQPSAQGLRGAGQLKVTDWNVLKSIDESEQTDESVTQDLFRGALYLYRIATGGMPRLRGGWHVDRLDETQTWQSLSFGLQQILQKALVARHYKKAAQIKSDLERLLKEWQTSPETLASDANTNLGKAVEKAKAGDTTENILAEAMLTREKISIASKLVDEMRLALTPEEVQRIDKILDYLKSQMGQWTDTRISIALFRGGSIGKATELINNAIPFSLDPTPLIWWQNMLSIAKSLEQGARDLAAETGEVYEQGDFAKAEVLFNSFKMAAPGLGEASTTLTSLEIAIHARRLEAEARQAIETGDLKRAGEQLETVVEYLKQNQTDALPAGYAAKLGEWCRVVRQRGMTSEIARDKLVEGQDLYRQGRLIEAGEAWADGLRSDPGNPALLQEFFNAARQLNQQGSSQDVLELTMRMPGVSGTEAEIRATRLAALQHLEKQNQINREQAWKNDIIEEQHAFVLRQLTVLGESVQAGNWQGMYGAMCQLSQYPQFPSEQDEASGRVREFLNANIQKLSDEELQQLDDWIGQLQEQVASYYTPIFELNKDERVRREHQATLGLTGKIVAQLSSGDFQAALETGRQWARSLGKEQTQDAILPKMIFDRADQIIPRGVLWEQYRDVFGKVFGPKFCEQMTQRYQDHHRYRLQERFGEIRNTLIGEKPDAAFSLMQRLLAEYPAVGEFLKEEWNNQWGLILNSALRTNGLNWPSAGQELNQIVEAVWEEGETRKGWQNKLSQIEREKVEETLLGRLTGREDNAFLESAGSILDSQQRKKILQSVRIENEARKAIARIVNQGDEDLAKEYLRLFQSANDENWGNDLLSQLAQGKARRLEEKFSNLGKKLRDAEIETALPEITQLLDETPRITNDLQDTWQKGWERIVISALSLPWMKDWDATLRSLFNVIEKIWPDEKDRQELLASAEQERSKRKSSMDLLLWDRMRALEGAFAGGNAIIRKGQGNNLTICSYRALVQQMADILPLLGEGYGLDSLRHKLEERQKLLAEADTLWDKAKTCPEETVKREYIAELSKRQFAGWQIKGDFERELGLEESKAASSSGIEEDPNKTMVSLPRIRPGEQRQDPIDVEIENARRDNPYFTYKNLLTLQDKYPNDPKIKQEIEQELSKFGEPTAKEVQLLKRIQDLELVNPLDCLAEIDKRKTDIKHIPLQMKVEQIKQKISPNLISANAAKATQELRRIYSIDSVDDYKKELQKAIDNRIVSVQFKECIEAYTRLKHPLNKEKGVG